MKALDEISSDGVVRSDTGVAVLVVDDESAVRRFAIRTLEREGYSVFEARDGAEALELVQKGTVTFHAVISDIVMPRLNGVELMRALSLSNPDLPVLLMSGYASGALTDMGITAPCAILPKPFPPDRLLEEVRRCLSTRK